LTAKKFLAFGCTHVPFHDPAAIEWLSEKIGEHKPDVLIHLGDLEEADAASKFPSEYNFDLDDEHQAAHDLLGKLRRSAKKDCRLIRLPGNHDANIDEEMRINKKVRKLCSFKRWRPEEGEAESKHWHVPCEYTYDRKKGVYRIGQVTFCHGYECGANSGEFQSILLGTPYGLYIDAHTHRPIHVTRAYRTKQVPLPYWYANVGCMRDLKPKFVERKRTHQWGQGIVVGEATDLKSPRVSREWSAHTEIFRMGDDDL
jgi:predicted phosphodiesterase